MSEPSNMETRLSHAEWRIDSIEGRQNKQDERTAALGDRIDAHHREVMAAISGLKDDNARREGVEQARREAEESSYKKLRAAGVVIAIITGLATLGVFNWPST